MAKGFKFKLEPVLRLRELREEEIKNELGQVIGKINDKLESIANYKEQIQFYFNRYEQSENNRGEMTSGLRQYMPEFLVSHYDKIKKCKSEIQELEKSKDELIKKLANAKGQVKIFSNLKEKKYQEFKKAYLRKLNNEIEEFSILKGGKND